MGSDDNGAKKKGRAHMDALNFKGRSNSRKLFWVRITAIIVFFTVAVPVIIALSDKDHREEFVKDVKILSAVLEPDLIKNLTATENDVNSDAYRELKKDLKKICKVSEKYRFAYLMGKKAAGEVFFYVDSEPEGSLEESLPGDVYDETTPELEKLFTGGTAYVEGPSRDAWGVWVSALIPIYSPGKERFVAVLGVDIDATRWFWDIALHSVFPVSVVVFIIVILLIGSFIRRDELLREKPVINRILPPLIVTTALMTAAFLILLWQQQNAVMDEALSLSVREITDRLENFPEKEARTMLALLETIGDDKEIMDAIKERKAESLALYYGSISEKFNKAYDISYICFMDKDGEYILKLPGSGGEWDAADVLAVKESGRTGERAVSLSLSQKGIPVLNVVKPVMHEGVLIGYVSMGREIGDAVKVFTERPDIEIAVVLPQSGNDIRLADENFVKNGIDLGWEKYGDHIFVFYTRKDLPAKISANMLNILDGENIKSMQITFDTRDWLAVSIPLRKMNIVSDGNIVTMKDITGLKGRSFFLIFIGWAAFLVIGGVFFGVFYYMLVKTDKVISDRDFKILEKNRDLEVTLESIADGVISLDRKGLVTGINRRVEEITGWSKEEVIGKMASSVFNFFDIATGELKKVMILKDVFFVDSCVKFISHKGEERCLSVGTSSKKDEMGNVIGSVIIIRDVTEEYIVQRELKESNERFKVLFDHSTVAIILHNKDTGEVVDANHKAIEMYGVRDINELKKNEFWLESPFSFKEALEWIHMAEKEGPQHFEWLAKRGLGGIFWEDVHLALVKIGGFSRVMSVTVDISDKKKAEDALRVSQNRLMRINGCLLSMGRDHDKNIDKLTSLCGELLGAACSLYSKLDGGKFCFSGQWNTPDGFTVEGRPEDHICYEVIKNTGDEVIFVEDLQKTAYAEVDVNIRKYGLRSYMGKSVKREGLSIGSLCVVYRDIFIPNDNDRVTLSLIALAIEIEEARKNYFERISESEKRFRTLVANVPGVIFRCANNAEETMWFISDRIEELSGYPADSFIGNSLRDYSSIIYPDDRGIRGKAIKEMMPLETRYEAEYRINCADGKIKWVHENAQGIREPGGNISFIDGVISDITEEKNAENIKQSFISTVSHELRTPLTAIKGSISLVGDSSLGPLNQEQKKFLDISLNNINRLTRLINDILDIQKMDSGELEYIMVSADINSLVVEVSEIMRFQAQQKGLKIITETDGTLPNVFFDKDKLTQVLTNLMSNAIKFTENGFIKVTTKKKGNAAEVSIQDTGYGISEDDMRYLFKPFRQINRKVGGTGLGLVISRRIIEKHGGKIWAESQKGEGSTFRFEIPIVERRRTA